MAQSKKSAGEQKLPKIKMVELGPSRLHKYFEVFNRGRRTFKAGRDPDFRDVDALRSLAEVREFYDAFKPNIHLFVVTSAEDLPTEKRSGNIFPRVRKGETIGACALYFPGPTDMRNLSKRDAVLFNQFVFKRFRGRGFGEAMRIAREQRAKRLGSRYAYIAVKRSHRKQKRRVEQAGYGVVPGRPLIQFQRGSRSQNWNFRKRLPR